MIKNRNTKQKQKIIDFLMRNQNKHLSINDIKKELGEEVGMTTIYRELDFLSKEGFVSKIPLENKMGFCYIYHKKEAECNKHIHLICEKCGKVIHCKSDVLNEIESKIEKDNEFILNKNRLEIHGVCKKCKSEE